MIFEALWESAQRGELVLLAGGMCHYHLRRDGQITLGEIIVTPAQQRRGIGRALLAAVLARCPRATSVFAKCPTDLAANGWYARLGFRLERVEDTRTGRQLNCWRLLIPREDGWL